jgi:hypothetical protein
MGDKASHNRPVFELLDGSVYLWVEPDEGIYMKAVDRGDPVELTSKMAKQLAAVLLEMAAQLND